MDTSTSTSRAIRPWYEMVNWHVVVAVALRLKLYRWFGLRVYGLRLLGRVMRQLDEEAFAHPTSTAVVLCCVAHEIAAVWAKEAGLPDLRGVE